LKSAIAVLVLCSILGLTAAAADNGKSSGAVSSPTIAQPLLTVMADSDSPSANPPASIVLPSAPSPAPAAQPPAPVMLLIKPQQVENVHRFFDLQNATALATLAAGLTGDALSTQKGLGLPGFHEMNPLARPFVQNRTGAALYNAASFALIGGGMYLAHKTGHHRLERVLPFAIAGWEGFLAARNYRVVSNSTAAH